MKVKDIKELNVSEFKKLLNEKTLEYLNTINTTIKEDLEMYQDGASMSGLDDEAEYIEVNEYFEAIKEQEEYDEQ